MKTRGQKGQNLVEVIIALVVLAIVTVSLFTALQISYRITADVSELTTAESLARAELEYIKSCSYNSSANATYGLDPNIDLDAAPYHGNYAVDDPAVVAIDPDTRDPLGPGQDLGLQEVTLTVRFLGEEIVTTVEYKVDR